MTEHADTTHEHGSPSVAQPLVSVIMPAYNAASTIAESIGSVVAQSYPNWELIVVDDGSTDDTASVVAGLGLAPSKLCVITQENAGVGAARNRAIEEAHGELIAFLDADDVWKPERLERQVPVMAEGGYDVVFASGHLLGDPEDVPSWVVHGQFSGAEMFRLLYEGNCIGGIFTVLTTKRTIARAGGFKAEAGLLGEDYDLWLRMANTGSSFCGLPDRLAAFRDRPDSHMHRHLALLQGDLAAVSQFDEQVAAQDPSAHRRRLRGLHNRLAAEHAAAGDVAAARRSLRSLRAFEPSLVVAAKMLALALLRSRYGALRSRVVG
jgi:teichuronic acid biosynthesis glycosyltransferase TuaG